MSFAESLILVTRTALHMSYIERIMIHGGHQWKLGNRVVSIFVDVYNISSHCLVKVLMQLLYGAPLTIASNKQKGHRTTQLVWHYQNSADSCFDAKPLLRYIAALAASGSTHPIQDGGASAKDSYDWFRPTSTCSFLAHVATHPTRLAALPLTAPRQITDFARRSFS